MLLDRPRLMRTSPAERHPRTCGASAIRTSHSTLRMLPLPRRMSAPTLRAARGHVCAVLVTGWAPLGGWRGPSSTPDRGDPFTLPHPEAAYARDALSSS